MARLGGAALVEQQATGLLPESLTSTKLSGLRLMWRKQLEYPAELSLHNFRLEDGFELTVPVSNVKQLELVRSKVTLTDIKSFAIER